MLTCVIKISKYYNKQMITKNYKKTVIKRLLVNLLSKLNYTIYKQFQSNTFQIHK